MLQQAFNSTPIFPIFGNHDIYPHWEFVNSTGNIAANLSAPLWKTWIDQESYDNLIKHGYYSQRMEIFDDKLVKVIGLNTDSCDEGNSYLFSVLSDPNGQVEFLIKELDFLEKNKGIAIIIAHITPDDGCSEQFATRFRAILERY
jgi:hypothetical protein